MCEGSNWDERHRQCIQAHTACPDQCSWPLTTPVLQDNGSEHPHRVCISARADVTPAMVADLEHGARLRGLQVGVAWVHWRLQMGASRVGGGLQVQSSNSAESGGVTLRQGGYALVNLRVGYRIDDKWNLAANVNNLFDKTHYQKFFSPDWNNRYGEPRSFSVSLRGSFR